MIRNKYILPYESINNSSIINEEDKYLSPTDNYNLYLERPLKKSRIKKVKQNKLYKLIDNIMCDKNVNSLLYSSNAKKISSLYLKQKNLLRQHVPLQIEDDNLFKKKVVLYSEKAERQKMMENIKQNIEQYYNNKKKCFTQMMKKNDEFINSQPNIEEKNEILEKKSINQIRLKGYKRAFDKCLNLSLTKKNFKIIDLNTKNVFWRLYNNKTLNLNNHKNKKNNSADKIKTSKENSSRKNYFSFKNLLKDYKMSKYNINNNNNTDFNTYQYRGKKIAKFRLYSNIDGKEHSLKQFNIGVTKKIIKRCWSAISGGPKKNNNNKEKEKNEKLKEKIKKKYNYKILSTRNGGDINDLSLYNTMVVKDPFLKKCKVKNKNFRDKDNNSALHIAVNNNSIKMVKYFLSKRKKNINAKNNKGQTSLHLACSNGNEDIINLLIQNGANIDALDLKGNKPFDLLSSERYKNL